MVLFEIVVAMTKLMAPVLSFTAEEIWRTLAAHPGGRLGGSSVHLSAFPEVQPQWQDAALAKRWERLLSYRTQVQGVLEGSRRDKTIGSSLEATVELRADADSYEFLQPYRKDLTTLFIVSQVELIASGEVTGPLAIAATKSSFGKCERCWNYRDAVGKDRNHPTLCDRCVEAVQ
jgi:isoleucyl-tRNA synthetase